MIHEHPDGGFHRNKATELGLIHATRRLMIRQRVRHADDDYYRAAYAQDKIVRFKKK
jgi:hypothetical protein